MSSQTVTVTQTKANGNNKTPVSNKKVGVSARLPNGRIVNLSSNEYRNYMTKKNQSKNNNRTPNAIHEGKRRVVLLTVEAQVIFVSNL